MPRHWRVWLWSVILLLTSALTVLAFRTVAQDRALAAQRAAEQRETLADRAAALLERRLAEVERRLGERPCPAEGICLLMAERHLSIWPEGRLLYRPDFAPQAEVQSELLRLADDHEFRAGDSQQAIQVLHSIQPPDARTRAAVLVRRARNHRKLGEEAQARACFEELSLLGGVVVGGLPAALAGRLGLVQADPESLKRELLSGRWPVSSAAFDALRSELPAFRADTLLEEAVERIHAQGLPGDSGRALWDLPSGRVVVLWRKTAAGVAAHVSDGEGQWLNALQAMAAPDGFTVSLGDARGPVAIRLASSSGLPWTVQAAGAGPPDSGWRGRTSIMAATLTCLFLLIAAAGWILDRTLRRQIALAHDQAHFVSAVSHEFRTPLTTLRQLTELLLQGRVASEEDRLEYYRLLHFESDRLQRLVEGS
jgi:signal transduction histidine kinase